MNYGLDFENLTLEGQVKMQQIEHGKLETSSLMNADEAVAYPLQHTISILTLVNSPLTVFFIYLTFLIKFIKFSAN